MRSERNSLSLSGPGSQILTKIYLKSLWKEKPVFERSKEYLPNETMSFYACALEVDGRWRFVKMFLSVKYRIATWKLEFVNARSYLPNSFVVEVLFI